MKGVQSLQEIMNRVSSALDDPEFCPSPDNAPSVIDELQIFADQDEVLARFRKDYLDAKINRLQAERDYGRDDGMTSLAADIEDSAWCDMQTRYLELRADREAMNRAQAVIEEMRDMEEHKKRSRKAKDAQDLFDFIRMTLLIERSKENDRGLMIVLLGMLMMNSNVVSFRQYRPTVPFNALAA